MKTSRRQFIGALGLGFGALAVPGCAPLNLLGKNPSAHGARPNIVLILADDMGYSDIGCFGSEIQTPNIDRLAADGLRFTEFYNGARCCPTRASLLTGLYAHQAGMGGMEPDRGVPGYRGNINDKCVTLAEALKLNGYAAYMAGKWHVTRNTKPQNEADKFNWPIQRGFDRYYGIIAGAGNFFEPGTLTRDNENIEDEAKNDPDYYFTDAISDNTVQFIRDHVAQSPDKPFFSYVAYTAPHWPLHALEEDMKKYRETYKRGWDEIRMERWKRMIEMGIVEAKWGLAPRDERVAAWDELEEAEFEEKVTAALEAQNLGIKECMVEKMAAYAAMIDRMDQGIGRIVKTLEETGQLDNTLILFLSDNGGCDEWGTYGFGWNNLVETGKIAGSKESSCSYGPAWAHVSNTPFRLYKLFTHEGGIATPLVVHWPAAVKDRGAFRRQTGHIIDLMPTLLDAAGGAYPAAYKGVQITPMQGVSLLPAFRGEPLERAEPLFWEHIGNEAIRVGEWKLVMNGLRGEGVWELYNVREDRAESNDLSAVYPEKVAEMSALWQHWAETSNVLPRRKEDV